MKEREGGKPAKQQYEDFLRNNEELFHIYKPYALSYKYRTRFGPNERKLRICRYCGRKMPDTTFKNVSHTISNSLGNINFISNDECDDCNSRFGLGIEREFLDYVSVYRSLAAKFEGHPYYTTKTEAFRLGVDEETNRISFKILDETKVKVVSSDNQVSYIVDGGYTNYHSVYRALVKFAIGMMPDDQLTYFKKTISWVNGEDKILRLPVIKLTVYNEPEPHPFMNMFFRKQYSNQYPYLVADFHVNHLEFVYVIPGCQQDKIEFKENILDDFLKLRKDHNQWHDLHMNCPQPMHMNLKATYYFRQKTKDAPANATVSATVNATVKLSKTQKKILPIIQKNKFATYEEISKQLDVERTTVWRNLDAMKKKGVVNRVGGDKNGYWEVLLDIKD